jgi:Uma2 family endonuclease
MLDENLLGSFPTEEELPDSDGKPVDNELQVLAPILLRAILAYIWADRFDWFFGVNLGIYPAPYEKAIGPDGFLSLGVERVRPQGKLRLSYVVYNEKVMPQWVLEVVSRQPGGEYSTKRLRYADMGVLYYTIYNPSHYRRDRHEIFEVYRLEQGEYVLQVGNPVWLPEIGLGIGHDIGTQEGIQRDWLYWYDAAGTRYLAPEDALERERILREREQLMRREAESRVTEAEQAQAQAELAQAQAEQDLAKERQVLALKMLKAGATPDFVAEVTGFSLAQIQDFQAD